MLRSLSSALTLGMCVGCSVLCGPESAQPEPRANARIVLADSLTYELPPDYRMPVDETDDNPNTPALPQQYVNTTLVPPTGKTIKVDAGDNLQRALDRAKRGDVISIAAGATFTGNFILRAKPGTASDGWIIIRTSAPDAALPPEGTRVDPATHAASMPKIMTAERSLPAIKVEAGASGYRLIGLEVGIDPSIAQLNGIVQLGDGSSAQNAMELVPSYLILDRVYVHGHPSVGLQRCVALNGAWTAIIDSYLSECHGKGFDSQAIGGWNGPGPFKIVNNYLEGSGENIMFGGADPHIANLIPSDIEIRQNRIAKPLSWKGVWSVKNLLELKNARRALIEGNVLENSWADGQVGFAVLFKSVNQAGGCPWCGTTDVTFRYNVVRNAAAGMTIAAHPEQFPVVPSSRYLITQNVFQDIGTANGTSNGRMFMLLGGLTDVAITHNTAIHNAFRGSGQFIYMDGGKDAPGSGLVIRDNVATWGGPYGAVMGKGRGTAALSAFSSSWTFEGNVIIGLPPQFQKDYPSRNSYVGGAPAGVVDWKLSAAGGGVGADLSKVKAALAKIDIP